MQGIRSIKKSFIMLLSERTKDATERVILKIAILSYLLHLFIIFLNVQGLLHFEQEFLKNPIAAIYTPFSFILVYEVFLLIYFLPKSITEYIGKQYEIITLIVIRRIFKDITYVELKSDWFFNEHDLQFTFDVATSLILFFIIYLFYKSIKKRDYDAIEKSDKEGQNIKQFVLLKRYMAIALIPIFLIIASYAFIHWGMITYRDHSNGILEFSKINNIFFEEFFTVLIGVDVLLLLASFFYSDKFYKIIRNSGFVLSTILIKLSFLSTGLVSNILIITSVLFGYFILLIHNLFEKDAESKSP